MSTVDHFLIVMHGDDCQGLRMTDKLKPDQRKKRNAAIASLSCLPA